MENISVWYYSDVGGMTPPRASVWAQHDDITETSLITLHAACARARTATRAHTLAHAHAHADAHLCVHMHAYTQTHALLT